MNGNSSFCRSFAVAFSGERCPPKGNHRITDEFVDGAAMVEYNLTQCLKIVVEKQRDIGRLFALTQAGEAFEIGKEREDVAALAAEAEALNAKYAK